MDLRPAEVKVEADESQDESGQAESVLRLGRRIGASGWLNAGWVFGVDTGTPRKDVRWLPGVALGRACSRTTTA
jgi:hypothetical protein